MTGKVELRSDFKQMRHGDTRTPERLIAHYQLETALAQRLLGSERCERSALYGHLYSELFAKLPDHPQHRARNTCQKGKIDSQAKVILPYIHAGCRFLEIGCGDAALSVFLSRYVTNAFALDVTNALIPEFAPQNFAFLLSDGVSIPLESESVDVAYSNQLMEHLHPEDAKDQLEEIHRVLKPGGAYICITQQLKWPT